MDLNQYQKQAVKTAVYKPELRVMYPTIGLAGEVGEVSELIKKSLRDEGGEISDERRQKLKKELGDVLWYVAVLAHDLHLDLDDIAQANNEKLKIRSENNLINGSGSDREDEVKIMHLDHSLGSNIRCSNCVHYEKVSGTCRKHILEMFDSEMNESFVYPAPVKGNWYCKSFLYKLGTK